MPIVVWVGIFYVKLSENIEFESERNVCMGSWKVLECVHSIILFVSTWINGSTIKEKSIFEKGACLYLNGVCMKVFVNYETHLKEL